MSCPFMCDVCSTEHTENSIKCKKCGYANEFGIASFWFDKEDAQKWYKDVIKPYRMEWQLKVLREQQSEFSAQVLKAIKFMDSKINVLFEKQEKFVSKEDLRSLDDKLNEQLKKDLHSLDDELTDQRLDRKLLELRLNNLDSTTTSSMHQDLPVQSLNTNPILKPKRVSFDVSDPIVIDISTSLPVQPKYIPPITRYLCPWREFRGVNKLMPKVDSTTLFGGYHWRVLDVQNGKALLLLEQVLAHLPYHGHAGNIDWENCTLRKELNGNFYNSLSEDTRARVVKTHLENRNNLWYGTNGGKDTHDYVFLLDLHDIDTYFGNSGDYVNKRRMDLNDNGHEWLEKPFIEYDYGRIISNNYDKDREIKSSYKETTNAKSSWWLRSPGQYNNKVAIVWSNGVIQVNGADVSCTISCDGVRPALWVK